VNTELTKNPKHYSGNFKGRPSKANIEKTLREIHIIIISENCIQKPGEYLNTKKTPEHIQYKKK
jgi:hypothetical protein